jgi:ABC-type histidine transport system ATPase subunit
MTTVVVTFIDRTTEVLHGVTDQVLNGDTYTAVTNSGTSYVFVLRNILFLRERKHNG